VGRGRRVDLELSASVAERLTDAAGAAYVVEQTAAVEQVEQRPSAGPVGPAVQQVSVDGARISLVGKQGVEVTTVAIGTVVQEASGEVRARERSSFSRRIDHPEVRRLALVETYRRGVGTALVVVAVMDGAGWLQKFIDDHRPEAIRVLDFPHAVEYLTRASQEALGTAPSASKAGLSQHAHAPSTMAPPRS